VQGDGPDYFKEGNQPEAVFSLPGIWTPGKVQQFQDYWDSLFSGNLAAQRRMKWSATASTRPLRSRR
jgi:hypothetical protein